MEPANLPENPVADDDAWNRARSTTAASILEDLESQYVLVKQERDNLHLQLETSNSKLQELNKTVVRQQDLELQIAKYKLEIETASTKIEAYGTEKNLIRETADRLEVEVDSLREEIR